MHCATMNIQSVPLSSDKRILGNLGNDATHMCLLSLTVLTASGMEHSLTGQTDGCAKISQHYIADDNLFAICWQLQCHCSNVDMDGTLAANVVTYNVPSYRGFNLIAPFQCLNVQLDAVMCNASRQCSIVVLYGCERKIRVQLGCSHMREVVKMIWWNAGNVIEPE